MKRSTFFFITAVLSFGFGTMLFFAPTLGAQLLGLADNVQTLSVLRGMGGLIIGSALINFLLRNSKDQNTLKALLLTNIFTHLFGLSADVWGIVDGALTVVKIIPVEITHLFIGLGSLICYWKLKTPTAS